VGALTAEERRRVFRARQHMIRAQAAWLSTPVPLPSESRRRRLYTVFKAAIIAALLGAGWLAGQVLEFHMPTSIAQALPRLEQPMAKGQL
jgi:hypothetical protein